VLVRPVGRRRLRIGDGNVGGGARLGAALRGGAARFVQGRQGRTRGSASRFIGTRGCSTSGQRTHAEEEAGGGAGLAVQLCCCVRLA
jgi:hypothetical protein